MVVEEHRASSPASVTCAVLTVSDSRTEATDTSGLAVATALAAAGHEVAERRIVPDNPDEVAAIVTGWARRGDIQAIITTGGTGLTRRDSTCEALTALFTAEVPGFGELFRMLSYAEIGPAAMLSRATAGLIDRRVVFVLPGSEAAVRLALDKLILPELGHVLRELSR
jgi:molybdenum cofactor biosynthesis protein B